MPTETRNIDSTRRGARGRLRKINLLEVSITNSGKRRDYRRVGSTGSIQGGEYGVQHTGLGFGQRGVEHGPGGETVAAAPELLGHAGHVHTSAGAKADLHSSPRL